MSATSMVLLAHAQPGPAFATPLITRPLPNFRSLAQNWKLDYKCNQLGGSVEMKLPDIKLKSIF